MHFLISLQTLTVWIMTTLLPVVRLQASLNSTFDDQSSSCFELSEIDSLDSQKPYTSIVVFGASWADNGHPRPAQHAKTLRGPPNHEGRYSNGITFAEYLANQLIPGKPIALLNYAYGGAVASNNLTYTDRPDTRSQTDQYIADLQAGAIDRGSGRVIHIWWVGINSMTMIWKQAIDQDPSLSSQAVLDHTNTRVDDQIAEVESQINRLRTEPDVNALQAEFIALPIPPLEMVLTFKYESKALAKNDPQLSALYLELIGRLSLRYNQGIESLTAKINGTAGLEDEVGWVQRFDFPNLWRDINQNPEKYGMKNSDVACMKEGEDGHQVVCDNPDEYVYWDTLHPTTAVHRIIAQEILSSINASKEESLNQTAYEASNL